jgi:Flp pilus assembly protein TadD
MSIILKALKSSEEEAREKKAPAPSQDKGEDGLFFAEEGVVKKRVDIGRFVPGAIASRMNKRSWVLLGIFVAILATSLVFKYLKKGEDDAALEPAVGIVRPQAQQAPQVNVPQSPAQVVIPGQASSPVPSALPIQASSDPAENAFNTGDYDAAAKLYKEAMDKDPNNAMTHNNLGMVYLKKELYSSAAQEFQKALEIDSNCAECFNNFGYLKTVLNQTQEAEKYFQKAMAISGTYPDPYFNLAVLYENDGDIGNAVKYYQQFANLYPDKASQIVADVNRRIDFLKGK